MTDETEEREWDFWEYVGLQCAGYGSRSDANLIRVFEQTRLENSWFEDIAQRLELSKDYVELLMEILCSADFCEYGTSPRGAWAVRDTSEQNSARLKEWFERKWGQPFEDPQP